MTDKALQNDRPNRSERKRTPLGQRNRISFATEDGYVYRLINDKDGRLQQAQEGGYDFVESNKQLGDAIVGTATKMGKYVSMPVGQGITGYLMRIKKEWYDQDQKEKQKRADALESATKPKKAKGEYGEGLENDRV